MLAHIAKSVSRDESGQDLIEYALLIAFIALVAVSAVGSLGQAIYKVLYQDLAQSLFD